MADHHSDSHSHSDDGHADHGGVTKYLFVFGMLCALTAGSFGIANSAVMNTPSIGWAAMMAISCGKAMLVILFFMHLKWEANWKYVLTVPASIMSIFLVLMLIPDIGRRTNYYSPARGLFAAPPREAAEAETVDENSETEPAESH